MLPLLNQDNLIWNDHISQHNPHADCPIYFDGYDDISRYIKLNSLETNLLQKINQVFNIQSKIGIDSKSFSYRGSHRLECRVQKMSQARP